MREGIRPNPKKDSDARRKAQPSWKKAVATHKVNTFTIEMNGKKYQKKRIERI